MKSMYSLLAVGIFSLMSVGVVGAEGDVATNMNSSASMGSMTTQPAPVNSDIRSVVKATQVLTETQITCVRTAVAKRELAIVNSFSTFASAMSMAYAGRASALDLAWTMTDTTARRTAVKSAWSTWRSAAQGARNTHRTAKTAAWTAFKYEASSCKASPSELDSAYSVSDAMQ